MFRHFFIIFLGIFFLPSFFYSPNLSLAIEQSSSVSISASIGVNEVTINGYTTPQSRVELTSTNTFDVTYSDDTGYFLFNKTLLPRDYSDLCLSSTDENSRHTNPVCVPEPPKTNFHTDIGPIVLPPTITLENSSIKPGSTVITSGQSIPNSEVSIHFYKVDDSADFFPKSAYAYSLPTFKTISDEKGNFNLNLPTAYSSDYRLYASTNLNDNPSPKSNTLIYNMPSLIWLFIQENLYMIIFLPIFLSTLILFVYLIYLKSSKPKKPRFLPAVYHWWPSIKPKYSPALYPEHIPRSFNIPD